jgi:hypothetical protein
MSSTVKVSEHGSDLLHEILGNFLPDHFPDEFTLDALAFELQEALDYVRGFLKGYGNITLGELCEIRERELGEESAKFANGPNPPMEG